MKLKTLEDVEPFLDGVSESTRHEIQDKAEQLRGFYSVRGLELDTEAACWIVIVGTGYDKKTARRASK